MSISDRDRKILLVLVPVLVLVGYWFLLLSPKREELTKADETLQQAEQDRDAAVAQRDQAGGAKTSFAKDYAEIVRLGKAIPTSVDMPSLIVQLDAAARGTGIRFKKIATGARLDAPTAAPSSSTQSQPASGSGGGTQPPAAPGSGDGSQPAAAGGEQAQSGPGQATESAGNATNSANQSTANSQAAGQSGGGDSQTSTSSSQGGTQSGGGSAGGAAPGGGGEQSSGVPGLDSIPLEFEFSGSFFDLADFFHRLKRFVRVANDRVLVQGRLMTIDGFKFSTDESSFPALKAEVQATVYLAPAAEGATAGATPAGPSGTVPASGGEQSGSSAPTSGSSAPTSGAPPSEPPTAAAPR